MMTIKDWYFKQTPRDQKIVVALAALVTVTIVYTTLIKPLNTGLVERRLSVAEKRDNYAWMQQNASAAKRASGQGSTQRGNRSAYVLFDQAISSHGLAKAERLEPGGKNNQGAKATFSEVSFDKLVRALGQLKTQNKLTVTSANINAKNSGYVSARLTVESGS